MFGRYSDKYTLYQNVYVFYFKNIMDNAKLIYLWTSCVWMSLTLLSSVFFCAHVFCYGEFREVSFQFLYLQKMDMGN